jgi:hypothetical protein
MSTSAPNFESQPTIDAAGPRAQVALAVQEYQESSNFPELFSRLDAIASQATTEELIEAAEPFRNIPDVAGPIYEKIVAARPDDARALVILAGAYWLTGRGAEVVGALATRAMAADPANRGAWHLWALTESNPRDRVGRWRQVAARFADDQLARANLADNAASLAGAEHDADALALAVTTYEELRALATESAQRDALDAAIRTLRSWRL